MRRLLFLAAIFGTIAACGSIVGVTDLEVVGNGGTGDDDDDEPKDAGKVEDADLLADVVEPDIVVQPPIDAGCPASKVGPLFPTTYRFGADNSAFMHWLGEPGDNVKKPDGAPFVLQTVANAGGKTVSQTVKFQGFLANIPNNKRIVGVQVDLRGQASRADFLKDNELKLKLDHDGAIQSANHANANPWPTEYETRTYGGEGTLWELENALTPATVNGPDFGITFILERAFNDFQKHFNLDLVQVTVYTCD